MRKQLLLILLITSICFNSCSRNQGLTGKNGEWIKSNTISIKATFTTYGVNCELLNESNTYLTLDPIKLVFKFKGQKDQTLSFSAAGEVLKPKERFTIPSLGNTDCENLKKFIIYIGSDNSSQQRVFTVTW